MPTPHGSRKNCASFCGFPASAPIRAAATTCTGRPTGWPTSSAACGFTAEVIPTAGHPLVYAESPAVPGAPTALVYGHYDVQPPDPLEKWTTPPFEPTRRDGNLYARGATDDKGQVLTHLKSAEAWITVEGRLPLNLKFLIEGEEEVGSEGLEQVSRRTRRPAGLRLRGHQRRRPVRPRHAGHHLWPARHRLLRAARDRPEPRPALRLVRRLGHQSGQRPGANPGRADRPAGPGDHSRLLRRRGAADRPRASRRWRRCRSTRKSISSRSAWRGPSGEEGYTTLERRWARPTFDIYGLWSGYQGEGAKTVLPATAGAKFSFRLVPNQDPAKITAGLKRRLTELCPPGVELELIEHHGAPGVLVPLESPYIEAAARAIEHAFGRRPVFTREGGSIPIVTTFHQQLRADALLLGWGQDDDNAHSPNEKFSLADFHRGIKASARLWEELSKE